MAEAVWLDEVFLRHWRDRDVFEAARATQGKVHRELERRQTLEFELDGKIYFIKRHQGVTLREILKNLVSLRLPVVSARNEYTAIRALQQLGIKVPKVAAYGNRGLLPARLESFLVTEDAGRHVTLEDHCRHWAQQPPGFRHKQTLIHKVAGIARRMHGAGICHRDFYLCHFLLLDGTDTLVLIDLHRALCKRRLGTRWVIKDLAGLYFSAMEAGLTRRDLLRFISHYRQKPLREVLTNELSFWNYVKVRARRLYNKHGLYA